MNTYLAKENRGSGAGLKIMVKVLCICYLGSGVNTCMMDEVYLF